MAHGLTAAAAHSQPVANIERLSDQGDDSGETHELSPYTVEAGNVKQLATTKFTVPVRDIPQSITIIPERVHEEQGAISLREILRNSPGISFQAGDQMTIRGFSARTDMYIDGVRDLGGYARDAFNVEQVEVAKGPSSAVAGRGSTGGAVNLVTKTPKAYHSHQASLVIGFDDYRRSIFDINQLFGAESGAVVCLNVMW